MDAEYKLAHRADPWLVVATFVLLGVSLLMVFSTTAVSSEQLYGNSTVFVKRHMLHILAGLFAFFLCTSLRVTILYRLSLPALIFVLVLLVLVLIPGIGHMAGGARRWLGAGNLRLQPGELAKIALLLYFSAYIQRHKEKMVYLLPGVIVPLAIFSVFAGLLLLEPDFGSTAVLAILVLGLLMIFSRVSYFMYAGAAAVGAGLVLVVASPYRFRRFTAFLDPFHDPSSSGYQLIQSLIAVGSGGPFGAGLGAGKQKLFYLPAAHTDFIFAVIAEELGLLGALGVLVLFLLIFWRGISIAKRLSPEPFLSSLALGCTLLTVLPALLNVGVVVGLLPTKGLVLPLVAYGGTAMIVHLATVGILVRLSRIEV